MAHLTNVVGFRLAQRCAPQESARGFDRPLLLFRKPAGPPRAGDGGSPAKAAPVLE